MTKISRRQALTMLGTTGAALALAPAMTLADSRTIICTWDRQFPPYSMERDGKMTGILIDCMDELLGKRMGFTVVHKGYTWTQAQYLVRKGEADGLCTNPTDVRKQYMIFSEEPMVESLPSIFCAVDNPRIAQINAIQSLDDLKNFRQVDYAGNGWAQKTFPPFLNIDYVENISDAFTLIAQNKADIFVGNGLAAMYAVRQLGLKKKIHARELPIGEPSSFHFGLRADYPNSQAIVGDFTDVLTEAMLDDATRKIILSYL